MSKEDPKQEQKQEQKQEEKEEEKEESKRVTLLVKVSSGSVHEVQCPQSVASILLDDSADSSVKELISSSLLHQSSLPSTQAMQYNQSGPRSTWTDETEKLLLEKYKELQNLPEMKNKWLKISSDVNASGYHFTPEQCRLKIKCLREKRERKMKRTQANGELPPSDEDENDVDGMLSVSFPDRHSYASVAITGQNKNGASTDASALGEGETSAGAKSLWTFEATKLLMEKYKEAQNSSIKLKNKWMKISSGVKVSGHHYTPEQCRLKIKNLREKSARRRRRKQLSREFPSPDINDDDLESEPVTYPDIHSYANVNNSGLNKTGTSTVSTNTHTLDDDESSEAALAKKRKIDCSCQTKEQAVNTGHDGPSDIQEKVSGMDGRMGAGLFDVQLLLRKRSGGIVGIASDAGDEEADLPAPQTSLGSSSRGKEPSQASVHASKIIDYQGITKESFSELVSLEKERLSVERRRLAIEERKAVALEKLVAIKQEKLSMNKSQILTISEAIL